MSSEAAPRPVTILPERECWQLLSRATLGRLVTSADGVDVTPSGFALLPGGRHIATARAEYQIPDEPNEPGVIQVWRLGPPLPGDE